MITEHTTANDDYKTMGKATLYTADDSTEQTTYKIHTRILDELNNGIAANYLVTTAEKKDYATTHLPMYTECIIRREKLICQGAIRAVTPQEYTCGAQIVESEPTNDCVTKKIVEISLTATNCTSYTIMINNPKGETITETCREETENKNEITGIEAKGTILLKSDCTIKVGSKQLILGNGEKQRKVHWDDMFSTLNKVGPTDQIVLPLLTIAGVTGGSAGFFLLTIILVIIAGCRGWHSKTWKAMMPIRKFFLIITCNCFKGSCSKCCGCMRDPTVQDEENPKETKKLKLIRRAEQDKFFRNMGRFISQSWDNVYEPHEFSSPLINNTPTTGPKPNLIDMTTRIRGNNEENFKLEERPKIDLPSAPM
jgi:hypothetical protein